MATTGDLYCYHINYSSLSDNEIKRLAERINHVAFMEFEPDPIVKAGVFYLSVEHADEYLKHINVPAGCSLYRVQ